LDVRRPDDHRNRESEAKPKLIAKHSDGVSGMAIMASVGTRHFHAGMWVSRLSVAFMSHVLHFETLKPEIDNLTDCAQVFVLNDEDITDGPSYNSYPFVQLPRRKPASRWDRFWIADNPEVGGVADPCDSALRILRRFHFVR
jgi:hypothetical protein